jgi:glycosyltransferase involved in cell wall biosynthesis
MDLFDEHVLAARGRTRKDAYRQLAMKKNNPKVSVILPVYNRMGLVERAVRSVLNQTYPELELIVIDDASTDNTKETLKHILDERIKIIQHKENLGAAAARNTGMKVARGEYIAFQDSDDVWLPEKLERQMAVFGNSTKEIGAVYVGLWRVNLAGGQDPLQKLGDSKTYIPYDWASNKEGDIHKELLKRNFIPLPSVIIRKECLEKAGVFDKNLPMLQDWEFFIRLSSYYKFKYIDQPLVLSFFTPESISTAPEAYVKALELIITKHFEEFRKDRRMVAEYFFYLGSHLYHNHDYARGLSYFAKATIFNPTLIRPEISFFLLNACQLVARSRKLTF